MDGKGPAPGMVSAQVRGKGSLDEKDHNPNPTVPGSTGLRAVRQKGNLLLIRERETGISYTSLAGLRGERSKDKQSPAVTQCGVGKRNNSVGWVRRRGDGLETERALWAGTRADSLPPASPVHCSR